MTGSAALLLGPPAALPSGTCNSSPGRKPEKGRGGTYEGSHRPAPLVVTLEADGTPLRRGRRQRVAERCAQPVR